MNSDTKARAQPRAFCLNQDCAAPQSGSSLHVHSYSYDDDYAEFKNDALRLSKLSKRLVSIAGDIGEPFVSQWMDVRNNLPNLRVIC